jgi:hypothetical protein
VARGIVDLTIMPNAQDAAIAFAHMPMTTVPEVRDRLRYGEHELESLADRTRHARVLDASISIGVGAAFVPLYLGPNDWKVNDAVDYFVLIGSAISVISGLINLLTRSEAERRWAAYRELRSRLIREHRERVRQRRLNGVRSAPSSARAAEASPN